MDIIAGATVLPIVPNWSSGVSVEWSYKTDIFQARDGSERRAALREKPRRELSFTATLAREEGRTARNVVAHSGRSLQAIPEFTKSVPVVSPATGEASTFQLSEIPYWIRAGVPVSFRTPAGWVFRSVVTAHGNTVVLDSGVVFSVPTTVHPVVLGRLQDGIASNRYTNSTGALPVRFSEEPTSNLDPVNPVAEDPSIRFRGFPVCGFRPNWKVPTRESFSQLTDSVDFDYGATYTILLEDQARWAGSYTCLARSREEAARAEDFFFRRKGRRGAFYMPTWQRDMTLVRPVVEADSDITVEGVSTFYLFNGSFVYRNVALITPTGLVLLGVKRATISSGNTVLTLDAPAPAEAAHARFASWLLMVRFASDQMTVTWRTDSVAEYDLSVQSVLDRFYELTADFDRITFGGDYLVFPPFPPTPTFLPFTIRGDGLLLSQDFAG